MNDSEHHPKVKVTATLGSPVFVAGGDVYGRIEIESRADTELGLRCIFVELNAVEQLTSKYHAATSQFIDTRRLFQGPSLPPSNAVRPRLEHRDSVIPVDYYPARKGVTSFLFKLPLPANAPSSLKFGGNLAAITYLLRAGAEVFWRGERRQVVDLHGITVVESPPVDDRGEDVGVVVVADAGKVWTHGRILEHLVIAGQPVTCRLHIKNNSLKKISNISVKIMRKLHLDHPPTEAHAIEVSDTLLTVPFDGPDYTVQSFSEGVAHLVVTVPRSARGLRQGPREAMDSSGEPYLKNGLFYVQCYLVVSMSMGFMASGIGVHIPLRVYHHSAVPDILRVPTVGYVQPTGIPHGSPLPQYPSPPINPTYGGHPGPTGHYDVHPFPILSAPHWTSESSPPPPSPQHQFFFDAYSDTQPQLPPWTGPAVALAEPPAPMPHRPLSAGPSTSQSALLEMPYALPYPENSTVLTRAPPPDQLIPLDHEPPPGIELVDDRASRISRHLRLTSRHRSVSPPRARRSLIAAGSSPSRLHPGASAELPERTPPIAPSESDPFSCNRGHHAPPLLSPRPRAVSSAASHFDNHSDNGKLDHSRSVQRSPQVTELERMAVEQTEAPQHPVASAGAEDHIATKPTGSPENDTTHMNKTLPGIPPLQPPTPTYSTAARGLPAAAFGASTMDSTIVTLTPSALQSQLQEHAPSGLTLLERRLGRPAAYEIFSQTHDRVADPTGGTPLTNPDSHAARNLPRKPKTQEARPAKAHPEDRRLDSDARVTAWLQRGDTIHTDGKPSFHNLESNQSAKEKTLRPSSIRPLIDIGGTVVESTAPRPVLHEDLVSTPPGLKTQPQVAVSSGTSQLDWRTLNRGKQNNVGPIDTSLSQPSPRKTGRLGALNPEASKHNVGSARGGRGGAVSSKAVFWSGIAASSNEEVKDRGGKATVQPKPNGGFTRSILPLDTLTPSPPRAVARKPHLAKCDPGTPAAGIINNTLAKPVISSSASLAKSSHLVAQRHPVTSQTTPTQKCTKPSACSDVTPLGRKRLQELISRYQNLV